MEPGAVGAGPAGPAGGSRGAAAGTWAFDQEVASAFDDMLRRSIPGYGAMRRLVHDVGRRFVRPGTDVVDLGCSRGEALAPYVGTGVRCVGVEVSPPMLAAARARFADEIARGEVELLDLDLRRGYPQVEASLTLSVLTLQFVPREERPRIVREVYDHTLRGGAFVLVEKVRGESEEADRVLVELHHDFKRAQGYTQEEIDRKRMQLEGVLVPVEPAWNEELLRGAGFDAVVCFWRTLNFAAWLACKRAALR